MEKHFFSHKNNKRRSKSAVSPYSKKLLGALYYVSQLIMEKKQKTCIHMYI